MTTNKVTAAALFSGGLDSILACRVVAAQGIAVKAIKFVTPFFDYGLLGGREEYIREVKQKYDIDVILHDISEQYLRMLGDPPHGYGKNFNPCLDCKIMMLAETRKIMDELGASFILTGEVVGQRPMSQRHDTLKLIARESGCEGILVRPLCAKFLKTTIPEEQGLIDGEQLLDFKGRGRTAQIELAKQFGIRDYPNPAGGCVLTDPLLSKRIKTYYREQDPVRVDDMTLLMTGRHFRLPGGGLLVTGRKAAENDKVYELRSPEDWILKTQDRPGPTGLLRYASSPDDMETAAGIVVRYSKKKDGKPQGGTVLAKRGDESLSFTVQPLDDDVFQKWMR